MKYNFLWLCMLFLACDKDNVAPAQNLVNVNYGPDAAQRLDAYLPEERSSSTTKVIILVHGGGWYQGDKADFNEYIDSLQDRLPGYAIFSINYRLANGFGNLFPTQENDVKLAIQFIYDKADEYKISKKFVLLGASAGGHLVLLHGYKYSTPVKVKAVIDFFGPTDLVDMYNNPTDFAQRSLLMSVLGGDPTSIPALYQQSSPINFATSESPPTLMLHGGLDPVVAHQQSEMLDAKLQTLGVAHQYVYYPAERHGWVGANLIDSFDKIAAFIKAHVD